ncbi:MAG: ExbD/TolR family protein [Candidatus Brocadiia bacterium]
MNFRSSLTAEREGFQLAPLIDIVFLLLVFFIVTSALQQIERQMGLNVPTAEKGKPQPNTQHPYYINVDKSGQIMIRNRVVSEEKLREWLKGLHESYGGAPPLIVIRADRETAFQHFVTVLDACAAAEIRNVAYANIKEPPSGS